MPKFVAIYEVEDPERWEAGFRTRSEMFKSWSGIGPVNYTVTEEGRVVHYGEYADDIEKVFAAMQTPEGARAMAEDGVKPETMQVYVLDKQLDL